MTIDPYSSRPCPRCGGLLQVLIGDAGDGRIGTTEKCVDCTYEWVWHDEPLTRPERAEIREAVQTIREVKPLLCPSCLRRSHRGCQSSQCQCPMPATAHPKRPA